MRFAYAPYNLKFKFEAGTSRGVLREKLTYLVKVWDEKTPGLFGIGEAPLFKGLSADDVPGYEYKLMETLANIAIGRKTDLSLFPSIQFGLEQAILDFTNGGHRIYFPSRFTQGKSAITINGLVWMGSEEEMTQRLEEKIREGFRCVKIKIGAIGWEKERPLIEAVRKRWDKEHLQIRVDANGGFIADELPSLLFELKKLGVHSIEQPVKAGDDVLMANVCAFSPVPVALDESLIGIHDRRRKEELLDLVNPAYIILKPALCGGFSGAREWMELAEARRIGWWITSALESNVGLNALAQWTATLGVSMPQGLGTGALFHNNFSTPLHLEGDKLRFIPGDYSDYSEFDNLDWRE